MALKTKMVICLLQLCYMLNAQPPNQKFWALNHSNCLLPNGLIGKPSAAFSLRKICCNYAGSAINVMRDADNTTQDIGFTPNGNLDTSNLKNFITTTFFNISYSATYIGAPGGTFGNTNIPVPSATSISSITAISGTMNGISISGNYAFIPSQTTITSGQSIIVGLWIGGYTKMAQIKFTFNANSIDVIQTGVRYYQGSDQTANLVNAYNNGTDFVGYNVSSLSLTLSGTFNGSAYIVKWYDQSGNGNNLIYQSTNTAGNTCTKPRIVNQGVIDRKGNNKRPAITFQSLGDELVCNTPINAQVINAVRDIDGTGFQYLISMPIDYDFSIRNNTGYGTGSNYYGDGNVNDWGYNGSMYYNGTSINFTTNIAANSLHTLAFIAAAANSGNGVNGARTFSLSSQFSTSRSLYNGDGVCELIIFPNNSTINAATAIGRNALQNNQKAYYGTP